MTLLVPLADPIECARAALRLGVRVSSRMLLDDVLWFKGVGIRIGDRLVWPVGDSRRYTEGEAVGEEDDATLVEMRSEEVAS